MQTLKYEAMAITYYKDFSDDTVVHYLDIYSKILHMPDKIWHRLPGGEKAVSWQEAPGDGKGKSDKSPGKMLLAKIKKKKSFGLWPWDHRWFTDSSKKQSLHHFNQLCREWFHSLVRVGTAYLVIWIQDTDVQIVSALLLFQDLVINCLGYHSCR